MTRPRRHARPSRGSARIAVAIVLGLSLLGGGVVYAAYRYDAATGDRLLPGVTIAGVAVGEMSRDQAVEAVSERAQSELARQVTVTARGQTWHVTPAELGAESDVEAVVDRALARNEEYSWTDRVLHRLLDRGIGHTADVRLRLQGEDIGGFLDLVAEEVHVDPTNAAVSYEDGQLVLRRPEAGWQLSVEDARRDLRRALTGALTAVTLPVERLQPEITRQELGYTIVVDLSELKLFLYRGLKLTRTYPVAAGSPGYPTPPGDWNVVNKVENPSWVNPAPDGWGAGLPAVIGPGPGNPLGTRALYLDAPGIRIHGTSASYSIGTYASHGCIRMFMDDVEELYGIVPIGTAVHVVS